MQHRKIRLINLLVCLVIILASLAAGLFSASCGQNSSSTPKRKILVVHSYHERWGWNQDISKGIVEGLAREGYLSDRNYDIKTFYTDTKITYITPEQVAGRGAEAFFFQKTMARHGINLCSGAIGFMISPQVQMEHFLP